MKRTHSLLHGRRSPSLYRIQFLGSSTASEQLLLDLGYQSSLNHSHTLHVTHSPFFSSSSFTFHNASRAASPAIPATPFKAAVAMGKAAAAEVSLVAAAEEADSDAEEAALRAEDELAPAREMAEEIDDKAEEIDDKAELVASDAVSTVSLEVPLGKMVVLPTVLVMVLPSVVMVVRISEVVIAPT